MGCLFAVISAFLIFSVAKAFHLSPNRVKQKPTLVCHADLNDIQADIDALIKSATNDDPTKSIESQPSSKVVDIKKSKITLAALSGLVGVFSFAYQQFQPVSGLALLKAMENDSKNIEASKHLDVWSTD